MDTEQRARLIDKRLRLDRRRNEIARGLIARPQGWTELSDVCEQILTLTRQIETERSALKQALQKAKEERPT